MQTHIQEVAQAGKQSILAIFKKIPSKKLFVFSIATHMTYILLLDPQSWLMVAMLYLGLEGTLDWKSLVPRPANPPVRHEPAELDDSRLP